MRLWTVGIAIYLVGWIVYIAGYNLSTSPETVAQRKTISPWVIALLSLFWPFLFVWTVLHFLLTVIGRLGRKEASP